MFLVSLHNCCNPRDLQEILSLNVKEVNERLRNKFKVQEF